MTSAGAGAILASSTPLYTSSAVPLSMPDDAARGAVAAPTFSREFRRTGGASIDVECRPQPPTTAASPLRTGAQLPITPVQAPEAGG